MLQVMSHRALCTILVRVMLTMLALWRSAAACSAVCSCTQSQQSALDAAVRHSIQVDNWLRHMRWTARQDRRPTAGGTAAAACGTRSRNGRQVVKTYANPYPTAALPSSAPNTAQY